jgi:hypothetical protein
MVWPASVFGGDRMDWAQKAASLSRRQLEWTGSRMDWEPEWKTKSRELYLTIRQKLIWPHDLDDEIEYDGDICIDERAYVLLAALQPDLVTERDLRWYMLAATDAASDAKFGISPDPAVNFTERESRNFIIADLKQDWHKLGRAPVEIQGDLAVVMECVRDSGDALEFASPELQNDREVVLQAVSNRPRALEYASPELRGDRDVVLAAVTQAGFAMRYASDELKADDGLMYYVIHAPNFSTDCEAIQFLDESLRENGIFMLRVIYLNPRALSYAGPILQNDKDFLLLVADIDNCDEAIPLAFLIDYGPVD